MQVLPVASGGDTRHQTEHSYHLYMSSFSYAVLTSQACIRSDTIHRCSLPQVGQRQVVVCTSNVAHIGIPESNHQLVTAHMAC